MHFAIPWINPLHLPVEINDYISGLYVYNVLFVLISGACRGVKFGIAIDGYHGYPWPTTPRDRQPRLYDVGHGNLIATVSISRGGREYLYIRDRSMTYFFTYVYNFPLSFFNIKSHRSILLKVSYDPVVCPSVASICLSVGLSLIIS